jgi:2,4-dienoyl-CoA reductase-like NADH-dependent reductase (Old Yellow Enzyme family)
MVASGRPFILNPDLPRRIAEGLALSPYDEKDQGYAMNDGHYDV